MRTFEPGGSEQRRDRDDAAAVEAETGAGCAEMRREELGEVHRIAGVEAFGEESEDREQHEQLPILLRREAGNRRDHEGQDVKGDERSAAAETGADGTEGEKPQGSADGLHDAISERSLPVGFGSDWLPSAGESRA